MSVGLAATLAALLSVTVKFVDTVENYSYDWRVQRSHHRVSPSSPIVLVEINESSVRALEPMLGRWPWPRAVHAAAIDYIAASGARVIAYDVFFGEHESRSESIINGQRVTGEQSDRALVDSVRHAGNVILLAEATYEGLAAGEPSRDRGPVLLPGPTYHAGPGFLARPLLALPFEELASVASGIGHNYLLKEPGSDYARRVLPFVDVRGTSVPSLGVAGALAFDAVPGDAVTTEGDWLRLGKTRLPLLGEPASDGAPSRQALIRFAEPPVLADGKGPVFPTYSMFDVLLSGDKVASGQVPPVPPAAFAGKVVMVGTSAAGLYDRFSTPFPGGAPGIHLHATTADNIIAGDVMRRASPTTDLLLTAAVGLVAGAIAVLLPVLWASVVVPALTIGLGFWLTREVAAGVWIAAVGPGLAASLALFGGVAWQYLIEGREKRHIKGLFGRYVSKDVIEQLLADPARANLGGERREMTVLFSDIRGFTAASEHGAPESVVAQLNEYFGEMVDVLFRYRGTLDKFVGDMVMGLFGAPLDDPEHADHAVAAALDMNVALERLNLKWAAEGRSRLDIGIGINSGEMIAGNIGSQAIMSYTVIGDAVNLGARLESLNKDYGTRILISDATRSRLTTDVSTRPIGQVTVKGRAQPVMVYEVTGRGDAPEPQVVSADSPAAMTEHSR
ncbi:MAG: adenylate/guanylate cyclase domain-containing protein [Vicinamibacterales bacterium]